MSLVKKRLLGDDNNLFHAPVTTAVIFITFISLMKPLALNGHLTGIDKEVKK